MLRIFKWFLSEAISEAIEWIGKQALIVGEAFLSDIVAGKVVQLSGPIFGRYPILIITLSRRPPSKYRRSLYIGDLQLLSARIHCWLNTVSKKRMRQLKQGRRVIKL